MIFARGRVMPERNLLQKVLFLLKGSVEGFVDDKVMKLSAALAYYTIFSIGPMLMVIILLCSIFYGKEAIEGTVYNEISGFVGSKADRKGVVLGKRVAVRVNLGGGRNIKK